MIATTSNDAKAVNLKALGAHHVINYRQDAQWGSTAKGLTPDARGVDIVVDVGGNATLGESLKAVRIDGMVVVAGLLGGNETVEPLMSVLSTICVVRGVVLGTKSMMADMIKFVQEKDIKMATDSQILPLKDAKAAFRMLEEQRHFAKIVIQIPGQ